MSGTGQRKFTVVCDFLGGTYIEQVRADTVEDAVRQWSAYLAREQPIADHSSLLAKDVLQRLEEDAPTPLDTLTGVWFVYASSGDAAAFINLIDSAV